MRSTCGVPAGIAVLAGACIVMLAGACGGDGPANDPPGGPPAMQGSPPLENPPSAQGLPAKSLPLAFGLPRVVAANVYLSRGLIVEAVYQATALAGGAWTGQIVNTGTLEPGLGGFQYSPQPADRLVVKLDGQVHEFVVKEAQGNVQALTAAAWLASPHVLRYTHGLSGEAEVEIAARYDGSSFTSKVTGWYAQSGMRLELDLEASGRSSGQSDFDGQEVQTEYDIKGTITGEDLLIDVDERHASALASATSLRLPYSMRGSASRFNATINNTLRSGGVEYRLRNVLVQTDTKTKGGEGQAGLTLVDGEVLRDGKAFGRCVLEAGRAYLETNSGRIALDLSPQQ